MHTHKEDPNNHAPAVTPDDDWDALDADPAFDAQLPPRRADLPKIPKLDVNLSEHRAIDLGKHAGLAGSDSEDKPPHGPAVSHVSIERVEVVKNEFRAGLTLDDLKQDREHPKVQHRMVPPSRYAVGERDHWGSAQKKGSMRWIWYTASGVILLVGLALFLSRFSKDQSSPRNISVAKSEAEENRDAGEIEKLLRRNKEAKEIFHKYVHAKSTDDFMDSIYLSQANRSAVERVWKPAGARDDWELSSKATWNAFQDGEMLYGELKGVNHDFSKFTAFYRYENTGLKLDWKATVGYGTASFAELQNGNGDAREIRGWLSTSDFYTQQLPDDRYHSFILTSPKKDESIWVYTEIGTDLDRAIMAIFSVSPITGTYKTEERVILDLHRGDREILPRQWLVKNLTAIQWLDQAKP